MSHVKSQWMAFTSGIPNSPLSHGHTHGYGRTRGGAGSGDVPVRGSASYPRDNRSYDEVGQEVGRGSRIVCARPHS